MAEKKEIHQGETQAGPSGRSLGLAVKESPQEELPAAAQVRTFGLPSQQSIDLLTRLLQEFERRSSTSSTVSPEVERDVAFVNAAFDSVKSALALAERPIAVGGVVPGGGPVAGGTAVTITGSHLLAGARVRFGNDEARDVEYVSLTEIRATSPEVKAGGTVDIFVDSLAGTARLKNGFTYSS